MPEKTLLTKTYVCLDCYDETTCHYWSDEAEPEPKCEHCGSENVEEQ